MAFNGFRRRAGGTTTFNQELDGFGGACDFHKRDSRLMVASLNYTFIFKSVDGGKTFAPACNGIEGGCGQSNSAAIFTRITPWKGDASGNTLYTHTRERVYKSTDYADSWLPLGTTGLPTGNQAQIYDVAVAPNNNAIAITTRGEQLYLSADGGNTWRPSATLPNSPGRLDRVLFDPNDSNVIYVTSRFLDISKSHLWRSIDFGSTWTAIDSGGFPSGTQVYAIVVDPLRSATLYAGNYLGVYRSTDRGNTWARLGSGMPFVRARDINVAPDGTFLRAATGGRGIWEIAINSDGGGDPSELENGVPLKNLAGAKTSEQFWTMTVPANASALRFVTAGGSGDADLYVKFGSKPSTTAYDCRSNSSSNTESCVIAKPQAGTYHVMLHGWNAYAGVSLTGNYSTVARTVYANEVDVAIIDRGTVTSAIAVAGRGGNAPADTQVEVDIRHSYRGDLKIELLAPDGTAYLLHDRSGGSADDLRQVYTVDLSGKAINGEWKLRVTDLARGDTGHIDRWSITL